MGNPQTKHRGLLVRGYFRDEPWTEKKPCHSGPGDTGEEDTFISPTFPYTVSTYLNAVIDAGFVLTRVEEPRPSEEDCRNRKWLDFWHHHAAMYLMVRAEKPASR